jgi:hypothetical protein
MNIRSQTLVFAAVVAASVGALTITLAARPLEGIEPVVEQRPAPAVYPIDKNGRIVYSHYGEGSYDETEKKILALLAEQPSAAALP